MTMDIEGILARYGIDIRDCPDRANLIAMYRSIERLEEHCFAMQNDLRGMQQEIIKLQQNVLATQQHVFDLQCRVLYTPQSSHAKNLVSTPDAAPTGGCAPREECKCSTDPRAPHGFARDASHSAGYYVCECHGWSHDDDD